MSDRWESVPIINYVFYWSDGEVAAFSKEMMEAHAARGRCFDRDTKKPKSCVAFVKEALGRQDYCWLGSDRRYWVWERDDWRVYVNNVVGFTFEVRKGLSKKRVKEVWNDFRARIGAFCPFVQGSRVVAYNSKYFGTVIGLHNRNPGYIEVILDGAKRSEPIHVDCLERA
jgi:hypothetical protein